jgi:rfaE bifunctional protein nucleotidyltransferase chain/domain
MISKPVYVYAAGVFDMLHYGHVRYLETAKQLGDILVVGLLTDEGTARYKVSTPIMSYNERYEVIRGLKCVDFIVKQDDTDPTATLEALKASGWHFDIMVRGDDYKAVPQGTEFIERNGGKVIRIPYCSEISSSAIRERIRERQFVR